MGYDISVADIKKGYEATYDYRLFHDPDEVRFECRCGEDNCCKIVRCMHPTPTDLLNYWRQRVERVTHTNPTKLLPLDE